MTLLLLLPLLGGCRQTVGSGTSVGNPGEASLSVAGSTDVTVSRSNTTLRSLALEPCDGGDDAVVTLGQTVNLSSATLELPAGSWCAMELDMAEVELTARQGTATLNAVLPVGVARVEGQVDVDAAVLTWEFGKPDWLALVLTAGDVTLTADDPQAAALAEIFTGDAAVYADDGDGEISDDERGAGPLAEGTPSDDGGEDDGGDDDTGGEEDGDDTGEEESAGTDEDPDDADEGSDADDDEDSDSEDGDDSGD